MDSYRKKINSFRRVCKGGAKDVIDHIVRNHLLRVDNKAIKSKEHDICMFCGSNEGLTKEHVLPKWLYEGSTEKFFTTNVNGANQTYNKTTIPACSVCNNDFLSNIEKHIINLFAQTDLNETHFSDYQKIDIIRWLEIIDYKFQILNVRRKFIKTSEGNFIPYLADFPISILRSDKNYTDRTVTIEIRRSQKRLFTLNKNNRLNSLVIFRTKNKNFSFFHHMDELIFIDLPKYELAMFLFYKDNFNTEREAYEQSMMIINEEYS